MLTPFAGSGSECVAAKMNGRKYIGFELSEEYCSIACERLKHVFFDTSEQLSLFDNSTAKRDEEE
jgi:DNA modification methylase